MSTPEESEFIASSWSTVCDLGFFLANEPEDRVVAALDQMQKNLNEQLSEVFPMVGPSIVDVILKGIQDRRHEIEAACPTTPTTRQ